MSKIKISMSWSGGKDSAFALWKLMNDPNIEITRLHTTFGEESRRVGMHGIHESLIEAQADALGLPLDKLYYPACGDNKEYEKAINKYLDELQESGISSIAYGDIFLEDLKTYREDQLAKRNFKALFPLWKDDTKETAYNFISEGFRTLICAADADKIAEKWVGKTFDHDFLNSLTDQVDPCGENGEFHTFCYDGPIFKKTIPITMKGVVSKSYHFKTAEGQEVEKKFWFADLG
ncbi:diphthine--ammonia ligase [Belliella kenyensis]|uniref:Diphthine--ammonia ligase n=1 Tax=Belliella kenyensis TaxID=1472724 RepID=A0ABV8EG36_9BACT|nr:diphthine--ammonia ligase [Belliella kenyensis]MCH7400949.1 diphthine--ammonia ligase [Belliella kenyensis]MDN3603947.1 diphthine--ammonia ligase [Belliella kenyensis]